MSHDDARRKQRRLVGLRKAFKCVLKAFPYGNDYKVYAGVKSEHRLPVWYDEKIFAKQIAGEEAIDLVRASISRQSSSAQMKPHRPEELKLFQNADEYPEVPHVRTTRLRTLRE